MNVIFFGNEQLKERLDNYWNNQNYVYYQIDNYKNYKDAKHIHGDIKLEHDSLIFIPYFIYAYEENEGNPELNYFIANQIRMFPGEHMICMFTDLLSVDITSVCSAYEGIKKYLDQKGDKFLYIDKYNYISINRVSKSWIEALDNELVISKKFIDDKKKSVTTEQKNKQFTLKK